LLSSLLVGLSLGALYYLYAARIGFRGLLTRASDQTYSLLGPFDWLAVLVGLASVSLWLVNRPARARPSARLGLGLLGGSMVVIAADRLVMLLTSATHYRELTIDLTGLSLLFAGVLLVTTIGFGSPVVGAAGAALAALSLGIAESNLSFRVLNQNGGVDITRTTEIGLGVTVQAVGFAIFSLACVYLILQARSDSDPSPAR
jgi:hypothetical protein